MYSRPSVLSHLKAFMFNFCDRSWNSGYKVKKKVIEAERRFDQLNHNLIALAVPLASCQGNLGKHIALLH